MHIRPAAIEIRERKTARVTRGLNGVIPKTCPREEIIQSPVERQAKKTYGVMRSPQGTSLVVPRV
jgi:hypothetical protein